MKSDGLTPSIASIEPAIRRSISLAKRERSPWAIPLQQLDAIHRGATKKGHKAATPPPEAIKPESNLPPPTPTCNVTYDNGDSFST
ncbi:hypothetical protein RvY_11801 [Ramazzottius varieornatus]|uniref:Uncharacterized protein n=1 Tax=Ramazzottius varieornatus TaxID=947166 RepID=A0A1D1VH99_RAMVA|nr:hypothetical protein RvY_11801 [Ramazzottius varieornatus]